MAWRIQSMRPEHLLSSLDLVERVFTAWDGPAEGALVRQLVEEIRAGAYHVPALELLMLDEEDRELGYAMFSRFPIEGRYADELLLLSPVGVEMAYQRRHISRDLIEYGFEKAREMGFKAVLVEGNPDNYRSRGFEPSYRYGVEAGPRVQLPHPDCLMVKALVEDGLTGIHGLVDYGMYRALT